MTLRRKRKRFFYMKKHDFVKTLQLVIFLALTAFCAFAIFTSPALYHAIATDSRIRGLFVLLWVILGLSFLFIFVDFCFLSSYFWGKCGTMKPSISP